MCNGRIKVTFIKNLSANGPEGSGEGGMAPEFLLCSARMVFLYVSFIPRAGIYAATAKNSMTHWVQRHPGLATVKPPTTGLFQTGKLCPCNRSVRLTRAPVQDMDIVQTVLSLQHGLAVAINRHLSRHRPPGVGYQELLPGTGIRSDLRMLMQTPSRE